VVGIKLQSRLNLYTAAIECIVTDRITGKIPTFSLGRDKFNFPRNIRLTDPRFHISLDIDLLIVDLYWNLRRSSQVLRQASNSPKNATWLDFGGSFGQHHIDCHKGPLASRVRKCRITRTCQSCLDDISTQPHIGGKHLRASLFRQRVSKLLR